MAGLEKSGATGALKAGWSVEQDNLGSNITNLGDVESAVGIFVAPNEPLVGTTAAVAILHSAIPQQSLTAVL